MNADEKVIMDASALLLDNEFIHPLLKEFNMLEIEQSDKGGRVITMIQSDGHKWNHWTIEEIKKIIEINNKRKPAPKTKPGVTFSKKVFLLCMILSGWLIVAMVKVFQWLSHFF